MKHTISAQDIVLYKQGIGAGVSLSEVPIPNHARDKDQFKSSIKIVTPNGIEMDMEIFIEVAPETITTVGKKIPRHLHGFISGNFQEKFLVNATYELGDLISHKGFSLVGVI